MTEKKYELRERKKQIEKKKIFQQKNEREKKLFIFLETRIAVAEGSKKNFIFFAVNRTIK